MSEDYEDIIKQYDNETTFFFLDPPYENTLKTYGYANHLFDYGRLKLCLKSIKGMFMLTLNDSSFIRNIFSDFYILHLSVPLSWSRFNKNGVIERRELIITNYKIKISQ